MRRAIHQLSIFIKAPDHVHGLPLGRPDLVPVLVEKLIGIDLHNFSSMPPPVVRPPCSRKRRIPDQPVFRQKRINKDIMAAGIILQALVIGHGSDHADDAEIPLLLHKTADQFPDVLMIAAALDSPLPAVIVAVIAFFHKYGSSACHFRDGPWIKISCPVPAQALLPALQRQFPGRIRERIPQSHPAEHKKSRVIAASHAGEGGMTVDRYLPVL